MRSRDKLGLLLGLVSIILIVYLIKGLPVSGSQGSDLNLRSSVKGHEIVNSEADIIDDAREAVEIIEQTNHRNALRSAPVDCDKPRSVISINNSVMPASIQPQNEFYESQDGEFVYVVQEGDNFAEIAEKVYRNQGSRYENIQRSYQANKDVLKSPDVVIKGQRLRIPPLAGEAVKDEKLSFAQRFFGRSKASKTVASLSVPSRRDFVEYRVQKGDTLWKISSKKLGNGMRYKEILELNKTRLKDGDELEVGMLIKIPSA